MTASITSLTLLRKNRDFRYLWASQFLNMLGDSLTTLATVGLALTLTGSSGLSAGLVLTLRTLPRLVFSNMAGAWADRYDRRRMLTMLNVFIALTTLSYLLVQKPEDVWLLYTLSGLMGILTATAATVRSAFEPDVAGREALGAAAGLFTISLGATMVLGYALGALVVGMIGRDLVQILGAFSFGLSALFAARVRLRAGNQPAVDVHDYASSSRSLRRDLTQGARYLHNNPFIAGLVIFDAVWNLGGGGVYVIMAMFNQVHFGGGDESMGLLYAAAGVGLLASTVVQPLVGRSWKSDLTLLGVSAILDGLAFGVVLLTDQLWLAAILFFLRWALSWVFALVFLPMFVRCIEDEVRGRILGLHHSVVFATSGLASLIYGGLLTMMSPSAVGWIAGGLMALPGVVWLAVQAAGCLPDTPPDPAASAYTERDAKI